MYLKELLNQKNIEQENSCYLIDASKQEILNLKKQNEEQLLLLEEKSNRILSLQNQIEELMILNSRVTRTLSVISKFLLNFQSQSFKLIL